MTTLIVPGVDPEPWPTLGFAVADWIEAYLVHGPGDYRGERVKLDDEQRAILGRIYEVFPCGHPQQGRRRFKRVALSVRKGWGKSAFAAMICAAELHPDGPVRTDYFDGHGFPVGRGLVDPYIPMIAYTEEQNDDLAYASLRVMLEEGPLSKDFDIGLMRIMRKSGDGKAVSLAAAPDARDGARTSHSLEDETHRFRHPRHKLAHRTMQANLPKRKEADAWSNEITTSFSPGEGSVAEDTMEYARAIAEGRIDNPRLFFFHRQASEQPVEQGGYDLEDDDSLRAAIIEAGGPAAAERSDIDGILQQFRDPTADRPYLCRTWLNWITQAADRAFDAEQWRKLARKDFAVPDGELITLGFDGSRFNDSTAITATQVRSGYQWRIGLWERPPNVKEWEVPRAEVKLAMGEAFNRWRVWRLYADPPDWDSEIAEWAGGYGQDRVVAWFTWRHRQMAAALQEYATAMQAGEITHDPRMQAHIGNACRRYLNLRDDKGERMWTICKERPDSVHKIDEAISGCLSWKARTDAIATGVELDNRRSVYEARGVVVVG